MGGQVHPYQAGQLSVGALWVLGLAEGLARVCHAQCLAGGVSPPSMAVGRGWGLVLIGQGAFKISFIPPFGRPCQPCFHPVGAAFAPVQPPRLDGVGKLLWTCQATGIWCRAGVHWVGNTLGCCREALSGLCSPFWAC